MQCFVSHDRDQSQVRQAFQACPILRCNRLLDQRNACVSKSPGGPDRFRFAPRLIHIDTHFAASFERPLYGNDVRDIIGYGTRADLQLEHAMTLRFKYALSFIDIALRVAARERPRNVHGITYTSAEQLG